MNSKFFNYFSSVGGVGGGSYFTECFRETFYINCILFAFYIYSDFLCGAGDESRILFYSFDYFNYLGDFYS